MGRRENRTESQAAVKFRLQRVPMVDCCYDQGGAYWGGPDYQAGMYPLYCAWGNGEQEQQIMYCRSIDRTAARKSVLEQFPNAKFYR
jgi:hypothetical protein